MRRDHGKCSRIAAGPMTLEMGNARTNLGASLLRAHEDASLLLTAMLFDRVDSWELVASCGLLPF